MSAKKNLYKHTFEAMGRSWLLDLNNYNEVPFQRKTSGLIWSLGELYNHLDHLTKDHIRKIEQCFDCKTVGSKKWEGRIVYLKGKASNKTLVDFNSHQFPPSQEGIKEARDAMYKLLKQMEVLGIRIAEGSPKGKVEHPVLGFLTAVEWYNLIVMLFEYHMKGKKKIEKVLSQ